MAGTGPAMRYERQAFLNIGTEIAPVYKRMGTGFETMDDALNPAVDEATYISDVNATKSITSYAPEWSFDGAVIKDSDVIAFIRAIGKDQATGADAETDVVLFDVWDVDPLTLEVPCEKFAVAIKVDSIGGGAGGEKLTFGGSLLGKGDPTDGYFDTSDDTFISESGAS